MAKPREASSDQGAKPIQPAAEAVSDDLRGHIAVGAVGLLILVGGLRRVGGHRPARRRGDRAGHRRGRLQRQEGAASDRRHRRRDPRARRRPGRRQRPAVAARRHDHPGQPADLDRSARRAGGAPGAAEGRARRWPASRCRAKPGGNGLASQRSSEMLAGEQVLFDSRQLAREGQKAQLSERVNQLLEEIRGFEAQAQAKSARVRAWSAGAARDRGALEEEPRRRRSS